MRKLLITLLLTTLCISHVHSKIFLYVIANNENPFFLKDVKRKGLLGGSYQSDGRAYDKIEEVIARYEGHEIELIEVNYSEMDREAEDSFETTSNLAEYLSTQIAKHKKAKHCFLTLNCWMGKNTMHLLTQMLDAKIKEVTVTEYIEDEEKTQEKKIKKGEGTLNWPIRRYNLSDKINKLFWINLELPDCEEEYPDDIDIIKIKASRDMLQFARSMVPRQKGFWEQCLIECPCSSCLSFFFDDPEEIIIKMAKRGAETLINRALLKNNPQQKTR